MSKHQIALRDTTLIVHIYLIICVLTPLVSSQILKCSIYDTVNITDSKLLSNGSYLYKGLVIPKELTGVYEHDIYGGRLIPVESHLRGCVCQLKACVKFCCDPGYTGEPNSWFCEEHDANDLPIHINITLNNGKQISKPISDEFEIQIDVPCIESYSLVPHEDPDHEWVLFENGTLALPKLNKYVPKNEYCLNPQKAPDGIVHVMTPMHCKYTEPRNTFVVNNICMAISVPFLLLTAIVYMIVPKLRTLYGKCLICYFVALAVGYAGLVTLNFNPDISNWPCRIFGYLTYFSFISAFTWLSVISFDLWLNISNDIRNSHRFGKYTPFLIYSVFTWGLAATLTAIVMAIQYLTDIPKEWKPLIGSDEYCWLPSDGWSPMLYFYGFMLISMIFNLTVFIFTARKIIKVEGNSHSRFRLHKQNYIVLLRLFILMGLTWLLEVGSFLVGQDSKLSILFIPADFLNSIQGIIIFVITVCRPKVLNALKYRLLCKDIPTSQDDCDSLPEGITMQEVSKNEVDKFLNHNNH